MVGIREASASGLDNQQEGNLRGEGEADAAAKRAEAVKWLRTVDSKLRRLCNMLDGV